MSNEGGATAVDELTNEQQDEQEVIAESGDGVAGLELDRDVEPKLIDGEQLGAADAVLANNSADIEYQQMDFKICGELEERNKALEEFALAQEGESLI